ncbi:MAG: aminoglycoside phosphotransferase [Chloroflexi bacterium]|nr:aminoglycoside phosphotransferase [Chloroflexota bacterium]
MSAGEPIGGLAGNSSPWAGRTLANLLAAHGLSESPEREFPNDGWSGATLTALDGPDGRFVLKRTSWAADWVARSTRDHALREAVLAADPVPLPMPLSSAHLGAAADGTAAAILMPDLSAWLIPWDRGEGMAAIISGETLDRVLEAAATIHAMPWAQLRNHDAGDPGRPTWPWCPIRERILWVGERFLSGWDQFDRRASPAAVALIAAMAADPAPLIDALAVLPATGLHGDLKLANVALLPAGRAACIDWQMTTFAPIALEMGWFLVSNVAQLDLAPDRVLDRYRAALERAGGGAFVGDWDAQRDLAIVVGLVLRGWRKGLDADAGVTLPTGATAAAALAWWCDEAVEAAARRL